MLASTMTKQAITLGSLWKNPFGAPVEKSLRVFATFFPLSKRFAFCFVLLLFCLGFIFAGKKKGSGTDLKLFGFWPNYF